MNRLGWNTVKLGEHALDGFAVDVGLIHLSQSVDAVMNTIVTVPTLTANTEIPNGADAAKPVVVWCESCGRFGGEEAGPSKSRTVRTQARHHNTQRFKQALTAGYYFWSRDSGDGSSTASGASAREEWTWYPCRAGAS